MKKFCITIVILFSFLLIPSNSYACGGSYFSRIVKYCSIENPSKTEKKECCTISNHSKNKNHKGCERKCGHSKCRCSSIGTTFISSNGIISEIASFNSYSKKQQFYDLNPSVSSGFYALWFIPKIS